MSDVLATQNPTQSLVSPGEPTQPLLRAREIHKAYRMGSDRLHVLTGASLNVSSGQLVAIMGASGSGKSTLLHILGALDTPDRGHVHFDGIDIFAGRPRERAQLRNRLFGFVFQFYHLLPELNVLENVLMPAMVGHSVVQWFSRRSAAHQRARDLLEQFRLTNRIRHRPNELSGGERQRVALARALINEPRILYADEPTGNLDAVTGQEILALLNRLNQAGQTIILVTHDPAVAAHAHRTLHLADGQLRKAPA